MNKQLFTFGAVALSLTLAGVASAQTYSYGHDHHQHTGFSGPRFYRPFGFGGYHSSTYEEGVLRGLGAYARSVGQANLLNSQAAINLEEAEAKRLVNAEKRTETYFRLQQINAAARQANRPARLSQDEYVALAKRQAPDRLSAFDYDRALGRLNWPAALTSGDFAAEREMLDAVFASRTPADTGAGSEFHNVVRQLTSSLQSKLQAELSTMSPMEFIAAKKFLTGLTYESQQPLAAATVAAK